MTAHDEHTRATVALAFGRGTPARDMLASHARCTDPACPCVLVARLLRPLPPTTWWERVCARWAGLWDSWRV